MVQGCSTERSHGYDGITISSVYYTRLTDGVIHHDITVKKHTHLYTQCRRTDDLKHADLTSGLRVYTHTVFQHCEPCLTSCCQTHTVMSVKPLQIHVSFHMVASPTIIVGIYHIKKNMKLVLICFCFLLFFSTGTVLVTTELVLNNTVEILHIFVW